MGLEVKGHSCSQGQPCGLTQIWTGPHRSQTGSDLVQTGVGGGGGSADGPFTDTPGTRPPHRRLSVCVQRVQFDHIHRFHESAMMEQEPSAGLKRNVRVQTMCLRQKQMERLIFDLRKIIPLPLFYTLACGCTSYLIIFTLFNRTGLRHIIYL